MIALVRSDPPTALRWRVREYLALLLLDVQFHEKEDPSSYCAHLSSRLHLFPPRFCVTGDLFDTELNLSDYHATLAALVPSNLLLVSVSAAYASSSTSTEPWYRHVDILIVQYRG